MIDFYSVARRRRGHLPGRRRRLAEQRRGEPPHRAARVPGLHRRPGEGDPHRAAPLGVRVRELRRAQLELPAAEGGRDRAGVLPRPRHDVLLLLRGPRRQPRRAPGRQLRRLGEVDGVDADLRGVQGQPDRPVRRPRAGRRRPRRRASRSRRSTPRRWPAATRPSRRPSRSRRRHEALQIRGRRASRAAASSRTTTSSTARRGDRHPLEEVRLLAPVQPRKFLAIGLNYADHIAESGMEAPEFPVFFNKQVDLRGRARATTSTCRASRTCSTTRASWRS